VRGKNCFPVSRRSSLTRRVGTSRSLQGGSEGYPVIFRREKRVSILNRRLKTGSDVSASLAGEVSERAGSNGAF